MVFFRRDNVKVEEFFFLKGKGIVWRRLEDRYLLFLVYSIRMRLGRFVFK